MIYNLTLATIYDTLPEVTLPEFNAGSVGLILLTAGIVAAIFQWVRGWDKRKGFRMVLKDRNDKIHALWLEIIQDGVDARLAASKISQKEADVMFAEAAKRMKLYDLVPKKRLAVLVKETLKRDRYLRQQARKDGTYVEQPLAKSAGDPPTPIVKSKFSERLGKAADKFRRKA